MMVESWSRGIEFLVERCWHNTKLAVSLHWSLIVDCDDPATRTRVGAMQAQLYATLQEHNPAAHEAVNGQVRFKAFLDQFSKEVTHTPAFPVHTCLAAPQSAQKSIEEEWYLLAPMR